MTTQCKDINSNLQAAPIWYTRAMRENIALTNIPNIKLIHWRLRIEMHINHKQCYQNVVECWNYFKMTFSTENKANVIHILVTYWCFSIWSWNVLMGCFEQPIQTIYFVVLLRLQNRSAHWVYNKSIFDSPSSAQIRHFEKKRLVIGRS